MAIPLPLGASRGDQIENAKDFSARGWLEVLPQEELTVQTLVEKLDALYRDREKYRAALSKANMAGASQRVVEEIEKAAAKKKRGFQITFSRKRKNVVRLTW